MFVGDIHASPKELRSLIKKAEDLGTTRFVSVGDLWDRGYDPNTVTKDIYGMIQSGKMEVLLGNHDWKFVRHFAGQKVSIAHEQEETLRLVTNETIDLFLEIFAEQPVAMYDPELKIFVSHAAGGRPESVLKNDFRNGNYRHFGSFTEYLKDTQDKIVDKRYVSNLLYGITNGAVTENGRPVRLPITKNINDDLEEWTYIFGHQHSANLFPENGNKHCVCVDYCSGEEGGKLAGLIIKDNSNIMMSNLIFG